MDDIYLHIARARAKTIQGGCVTATGYSGKVQGLGKKRLNSAASIFRNYLDELTPNQGSGGKTAFTCAEPKVILDALNNGATPESINLYQIKCKREDRAPCQAWCSQYLSPSPNGAGYVIDDDVIDHIYKHMPRYR
ncbi:hypothetical protein ACO0LO_15130 [Undibacterium sp. TJN25]|uniref:hypothetical protein n=1 Tax=Undibacterium sp. TJN25 TaxID=3413056 RepID=UPI003BF16000